MSVGHDRSHGDSKAWRQGAPTIVAIRVFAKIAI
jgi:hypothetical protein